MHVRHKPRASSSFPRRSAFFARQFNKSALIFNARRGVGRSKNDPSRAAPGPGTWISNVFASSALCTLRVNVSR